MAKTPTRSFARTLLVFSVLLNVVFLVFWGKRYPAKPPAAYSPPPKLPYYMGRNELFETLPADSNAVVFLGNSLTQYFELSEYFNGVRVKNRGIHGDMLEPALKRLSPVIVSKPKKIFIELGVNDVERGIPKEDFLSLYARLLDTLKSTCPKTVVYVQSLLPVADTSRYLPASYCSPQTNRNIAAVNVALQRLAAEKKCTFLDLHGRFLANGQLHPQLTVDGVHLSGAGYRLWANLLKSYVNGN